MHLNNIFKKELNENLVCKEFLHTAGDGKNYKTKYYNLDAIIAVGFKVNSKRAIDFRLWAINILKQYSVKGYVLDNPGKVSHKMAESFALSEFEKYRIIQDKLFESDFDKFILEMEQNNIDV